MKKRILIILSILLVLIAGIYFIKKTNLEQENSILPTICNGTLLKIKNENPKEFLNLYNKAKNKTSGAIDGKCMAGEDLVECIDRNTDFLRNMNCMAKFLNQSDLSEKEIMQIKERIN